MISAQNRNTYSIIDLPGELRQKILEASVWPPSNTGVDQDLATLREVSKEFKHDADAIGAQDRRRHLSGASRSGKKIASFMFGDSFEGGISLATRRTPPPARVQELFGLRPLVDAPGNINPPPPCYDPGIGSIGHGSSAGIFIYPQGRLRHPFGWRTVEGGGTTMSDFTALTPPNATYGQEPVFYLRSGIIIEGVAGQQEGTSGLSLRLCDWSTGEEKARHFVTNANAFNVARGGDDRTLLLSVTRRGERGMIEHQDAFWGACLPWTPLPKPPLASEQQTGLIARVDACRQQAVAIADRKRGQEIGTVQVYLADLCPNIAPYSTGWRSLEAEGPNPDCYYTTHGRDHEHFAASSGYCASIVFEEDKHNHNTPRELVLAWDTKSGRLLYQQILRNDSSYNVHLDLSGDLLALTYDSGHSREKRLRLVNLSTPTEHMPLWDVPLYGPEGVLESPWQIYARITLSFGNLWITDCETMLAALEGEVDTNNGQSSPKLKSVDHQMLDASMPSPA